jgi:glycosyltransferase involved in cell wall biosynthesis
MEARLLNETSPSFSVVIPAYQAAHFIRGALDSVLGQTLPPSEIVVCDDGSTDDLNGALAPYADSVVTLRQQNLGQAAALNACCRTARGEFVVLLGADDSWFPNRLSKIADVLMEDPNSDLITTDAVVLRANRRLHWYADFVKVEFPLDQTVLRRRMLEGNLIFAHAAFRRSWWERLGGFDESLRISHDYDMWLRMILSGAVARLVPEPLSIYRLHGANISSNTEAMRAEDARVLTKALLLGLGSEEVGAANAHLRDIADRLQLIRARDAVLGGHDDARSRCLSVATNARQPPNQRVKAALGAFSPTLARRFRHLGSAQR